MGSVEIKGQQKTRLIKALLGLQKKRQEEVSKYNWRSKARTNQLPPEVNWRNWMILAGRGFGKTRTGAETVRMYASGGECLHIALIGKTIAEARSVMVEGQSGILACHRPDERPQFQKTQNRLVWKSGEVAWLFGGDNFEKLRGPQFDFAWIDELAKFRYPKDLWDQLSLGLRLGKMPRCIITTTPRPVPIIQHIISAPDTVVTRGATFDNADNLAPDYLKRICQQFENTSLGAQELYGQILTEREGALWQRSMIKYQSPDTESFKRVVIAIDPATTHHDQSDETGIIVAAIDGCNQAYILDDLSGRHSPADWGQRVVNAYWRHGADRVVAEVNKGGDLVERVIKSIDPNVSYKAVRATRGKATRAEPIAALYEQGKVHHARPLLKLEEQLCDYIPGVSCKSPDRLDAMVWALTELLFEGNSQVLKVWT